MIIIRGNQVFESADHIRVEINKCDVELSADGLFISFDSRNTALAVVQEELALHDDQLFLVKEGFTSLAWFKSEEEAVKFVERLREAILVQKKARYRREVAPYQRTALKRVGEFLGTVAMATVIAFVGGAMAFPGWKVGEGLFLAWTAPSEVQNGLSFDDTGVMLPPADATPTEATAELPQAEDAAPAGA